MILPGAPPLVPPHRRRLAEIVSCPGSLSARIWRRYPVADKGSSHAILPPDHTQRSAGRRLSQRVKSWSGGVGDEGTQEVAEHLHLPANRELHEVSNIQTILRLSPVLAKIVEQGNQEKVFNTKRPLETMQFLLTGGQFLLDGGLFNFSEQEIAERRIVMQEIIEKALGADPGTFDFMNNISTGDKNE